MSQLLNLPTEVLLQIIDDMLPPDLENFCRCCKGLEKFAEKALLHHQSMKASYSNISCDSYLHGFLIDNNQHPIAILQAILKDDRFAYYPREIEVGSRGLYNSDAPDCQVISTVANSVKDSGSKPLSLVSQSPYFLEHNTSSAWNTAIASGDGRTWAALAISLLPNLRSIILTGISTESLEMIEMLGSIARANLESPLAKPLALGKLSAVHLFGYDHWWQDFVLLKYFALLPSVRHIYRFKIDGVYPASAHKETYEIESPPAGVTELVLEKSSISALSFAELFSGITALQKFKYEAIVPDPGLESNFFEPPAIVVLLLKHAMDSLIELDLTFYDRNMVAIDFEYKQFMGSLCDFENLRHIRVDSALFFRNSKADNYWDADTWADYEMSTDNSMRDPLVPLAYMLPASVETLVLVGVIWTQHALRLFEGLSWQKETLFPKFRAVTFESPGELLKVRQVKDLCRDCGISMSCTSTYL